jgi:hypothetical protein
MHSLLLRIVKLFQKTSALRGGFMKSRTIQDIINKVWFKTSARSKADAIQLCEMYEKFPLVALALTLTAVCFQF